MAAKLGATFSAALDNLERMRNYIAQAAHDLQVPRVTSSDVVQAVDEVVTNIIVHGYQGADGVITLGVERQGNQLIVSVRDWARPFDPTDIPPPDLSLGLEQRRPGGLGVYMVRQLVDQIQYRAPAEGGNELMLVKYLSKEENTS